jgi:hypothetical protein
MTEHPPTREQIESAVGEVLFNSSNYPQSAIIHIIGRDMSPLRAKVVNAVLALFAQPTPMQECGVCGRHYPAADTRSTCPVCWPGFGEYGHDRGCASRTTMLPVDPPRAAPCDCGALAEHPTQAPTSTPQPAASARQGTEPTNHPTVMGGNSTRTAVALANRGNGSTTTRSGTGDDSGSPPSR